MDLEKLTEKNKIFCYEYIIEWNQTKAYMIAYPDCKTENSACASANKLLTNTNIQTYIKEIQEELEKNAGISRLKVVLEHKKIAFSSIAHLHKTWITRKEFEYLTDEQKDCIESIDVKTVDNEQKGYSVEHVKIKLYDKQKALEAISKMLGYNEPDKLHHTLDLKDITPFTFYKNKE